MGMKKKLGLGVASAALGLSLVGGGTWAAFNDTAQINNSFAAGTLDLAVVAKEGKPINFDLSNLKPGDSIERIFTLDNIGTLAIDKVLLGATTSGWANGANEFVRAGGTDNSENDFLSQFQIQMFKVDRETDALVEILSPSVDFTLADLVNKEFGEVQSTYVSGDRLNLTPTALSGGNLAQGTLPAEPLQFDADDVYIKILFKGEAGNQYQGDSVKVHFNLEATQKAGVNIGTDKGNGYLRSNALNNGSNPATTPNTTTVDDVTDKDVENNN